MRFPAVLAALLIATPALAQTAPPGSQPVHQPSLQEQIDGVVGKITGNISDLRTAIIQYAGQADAARQQLAEANQALAAANAKVADLTKQVAGQTTGKVEATEPTKKE